MSFAGRNGMTPPPPNSTKLDGFVAKDMQASGLALSAAPGGGLWLRAERLQLGEAVVKSAWGTARIAAIALTNASLRFGPPAARSADAAPSLVLQTLRADQLELQGVDLELDPAHAARGDAQHWQLEPLAALQGELAIFIRDAAWVVDAEITMPIEGGRIDFDRVVVEHVGPNSSMGISRSAVYVDAPNFGRTELFRFDTPLIPGAVVEARGGFTGQRITDRGRLDLQAFAQAALSAPAGQAIGRIAGREVTQMLDRTKLSGELRLGDGAIGVDGQQITLSGQALGQNRISLSAAVLGHRLVLRLPEVAASGSRFTLLGRGGRTGPITASLEAHVTGLASSDAPSVTVTLYRVSVLSPAWGDVD